MISSIRRGLKTSSIRRGLMTSFDDFTNKEIFDDLTNKERFYVQKKILLVGHFLKILWKIIIEKN